MTESTEKLILEHLRASRARIEQHSEEFTFLKERMTSIEKQMAGLHTKIACLHPDSDADADWAEFEKGAGLWSGKFVRDDSHTHEI